MQRDEAERRLREALFGYYRGSSDELLEEALTALLGGEPQPSVLSAEVIERMAADEVGNLTRLRTTRVERIDSAMARGNMPSPFDLEGFGQVHQQLSLWRGVQEELDKEVDPIKALAKQRKLAYEMILGNSTAIGSSYARALSDVSRRAGALFLAATDGQSVDD